VVISFKKIYCSFMQHDPSCLSDVICMPSTCCSVDEMKLSKSLLCDEVFHLLYTIAKVVLPGEVSYCVCTGTISHPLLV